MDFQNATLGELVDMGGWSLSPKFHGYSFILTKEGLFKRNPYGGETYRMIRIRDAMLELGLRDAPELVRHAFDYFTGSYSILLDRLVKSGEYHAKKMSGSITGSNQMNKTAVAQEIVKIAKILTSAYDVTPSEILRFRSFTRDLAVLSKKYGVVIKSVGGVEIGTVGSIRYSDDPTSGDLMPSVSWVD